MKRRNSEPAAYVKSAEGRAAGGDVPGASAAMKTLALATRRLFLSRQNGEPS